MPLFTTASGALLARFGSRALSSLSARAVAAAPRYQRPLLQMRQRSISSPSDGNETIIEPHVNDKPKKFFEFEKIEENTFRSHNLTTSGQQSVKAAYGGLVMAQAMAAAEATVPPEFKPHSMHSYFILNVDTTVPVDYNVRRLRDGRSFVTRSVEATQNGKVAFSMQASFHVVEPDSCAHQSSYPTVTVAAEDCQDFNTAAQELIKQLEDGRLKGSEHTRAALARYTQVDRTKWLFDFRCTDTGALFGLGDPPKSFFFWIRSRVPVDAKDERLHRQLIVFASDAAPAGVIFRPHTRNDFTPSQVFTLDHVMHFHESQIRADEWLLYEVESTKAAAGRGFARGRIWRSDGTLLVSITQEALVRTRGAPSRLW